MKKVADLDKELEARAEPPSEFGYRRIHASRRRGLGFVTQGTDGTFGLDRRWFDAKHDKKATKSKCFDWQHSDEMALRSEF